MNKALVGIIVGVISVVTIVTIIVVVLATGSEWTSQRRSLVLTLNWNDHFWCFLGGSDVQPSQTTLASTTKKASGTSAGGTSATGSGGSASTTAIALTTGDGSDPIQGK